MRKIITFFLSLIVLVLLVTIGFIVWALYSGYTVEDIYKEVASKLNITIAEPISDENYEAAPAEEKIMYSEQSSKGKFYYEQLNARQKILYNGFQENKENMISGTYVIEYGNAFSDILQQENGSKILQADYQSAIEAYTHDNPEIFYLDITKLFLNIETIKKVWNTKYNVYIGPASGKTYYSDEYTSEVQVRAAYNKIENIKNGILEQLSDNQYDNIKMIHDYLIKNIEYDQELESKGTYSIYGALIENKCVCDGYTRAFKYLTNSAGYECEIIQGIATNDKVQVENHAWNAIKLDEEWYYVDVTWDDPVIIGRGYVPNSYYYKYFLKGSKNFEKNHELDGKFSDEGKEFDFPTVSVTDYKK